MNAYGYSWNKQYITVGLGDIVHWDWNSPTGISGINFKVEQVADAVSTLPIGFTSGDPKPSGILK